VVEMKQKWTREAAREKAEKKVTELFLYSQPGV
jgi:hypothetical protein